MLTHLWKTANLQKPRPFSRRRTLPQNQNFFGSAEMTYKAGECSFRLKEYQKALEFFTNPPTSHWLKVLTAAV
jgi:hypothetical protein